MKHETWCHHPSAHGSTQPVAARFADVDTRRHVNNIAVYGMHPEARQRWLTAAGGGLPEAARIGLHFEPRRAAPAHLALAPADGVRVYTDPAGRPGTPALPPALQSFHWLSGDTPCP